MVERKECFLLICTSSNEVVVVEETLWQDLRSFEQYDRIEKGSIHLKFIHFLIVLWWMIRVSATTIFSMLLGTIQIRIPIFRNVYRLLFHIILFHATIFVIWVMKWFNSWASFYYIGIKTTSLVSIDMLELDMTSWW